MYSSDSMLHQPILLELGNGFAYVGKEVRLLLGYTEMYCDLLFYNIKAL